MESLNIQIDKNNVEQQKAFDLVANTNTCLFITGKAGTGKTTFIKRIPSLDFPCKRWDHILGWTYYLKRKCFLMKLILLSLTRPLW